MLAAHDGVPDYSDGHSGPGRYRLASGIHVVRVLYLWCQSEVSQTIYVDEFRDDDDDDGPGKSPLQTMKFPASFHSI